MYAQAMTGVAALPRLNSELALEKGLVPPGMFRFPERVLQFGEGNFLRAFVGWMIDGLNRKGEFSGRIVVVQPIARGLAGKINEQDGLYTVLLRGLQNGEVIDQRQTIASVSRAIDPYTAFDEFLACARNPDLRFIVSNTTEAGIVFDPADRPEAAPPSSFPGKLTRFLLERYREMGGAAAPGFVLLPCELIDRNGDTLRDAVLRTAASWQLDAAFERWVEEANVFANTLVDRIVTGYPGDEADRIWSECGYRDELLDAGEPFHFWAIEAPAGVAGELPLAGHGFHVAWTRDLKPYRDRKVRLLNGAHTSTALAAHLAGRTTVRQCMEDPVIATFLRGVLFDEAIPTLDLPRPELEAFATAVMERFRNPFLNHLLLSIALNSVSKYRARVLPSVEDFVARERRLPQRMTFALAALIVFYRGPEARDDAPVIARFGELWKRHAGSPRAMADAVLAQTAWWGRDLREIPGFADATGAYTEAILRDGVYSAMARLEGGGAGVQP